jgi:hypothetical protein
MNPGQDDHPAQPMRTIVGPRVTGSGRRQDKQRGTARRGQRHRQRHTARLPKRQQRHGRAACGMPQALLAAGTLAARLPGRRGVPSQRQPRYRPSGRAAAPGGTRREGAAGVPPPGEPGRPRVPPGAAAAGPIPPRKTRRIGGDWGAPKPGRTEYRPGSGDTRRSATHSLGRPG